MYLQLMYLQSHIYKNTPVSFDFISTWNQGVFLCSPCIIPSYSQQDATFLVLFISKDTLHISGGSSTHHQEHTTVQTASGIVNQYCC